MNEHDAQYIDELCKYFHDRSRNAGWWNDLATGEPLPRDIRTFCVKLILVHSELSEALEGMRKNLMDDKLPHMPMVTVELADAMIRMFDLCGGFGLQVGSAVKEKDEYNAVRPDHKIENRLKDGGKTV